MTQQQIGYINAQTSRQRLQYEREQAHAAMQQAEAQLRSAKVAEQKQKHYEDTEFWWNVGTGAAATIGGLLLLAFL